MKMTSKIKKTSRMKMTSNMKTTKKMKTTSRNRIPHDEYHIRRIAHAQAYRKEDIIMQRGSVVKNMIPWYLWYLGRFKKCRKI